MTADRKIPGPVYINETKNKILDEATKLFAKKGFGAVSMRDIGTAVGIKMSSIYNYYDSKEDLFEDIMSHFESGYRHYYEWLKSENMKADTLEQVMDNFFNKELIKMLDPLSCLGISLAIKEQHHLISAQQRVFDLVFKLSIEYMSEDLNRLIERGIIPPSDTKTIATIFLNNILATNDMQIHEYMGVKPPVKCKDFYLNLKKFLTNALMHGSLE